MKYDSYPQTEGQKKVYAYFLEKARQEKAWAERIKKDKEWLASASDMSKQMLSEYLSSTQEELALKHYRYLKMRAHATSDDYSKYPLDPVAYREWTRLSGAKPRTGYKGSIYMGDD